MRGADSLAAYSPGSAEWDGSVSGPLSGSFSLCSSPSPSASLCLPLFLSASVRESNDQWSAPRTPPGFPHGDKLTMGDKVPQNCLGDEEVLNVPFAPPGPETADLVRTAKTGKRGGMSQCQKISKIRRER